jgi:hypothetical protein
VNVGQWADKDFHASGRSRKNRNIIKKTKTWHIDTDVTIAVSGFLNRSDGTKDMRVRSYGSGHDKMVGPGFIPKYIAVRGKDRKRVVMCPMELADGFFVGVAAGEPSGDISVDLYGVSFRGYSLYLGSGMSARYVYYDNYVVGIPRNAMAEFSLALAGQVDYNLFDAADVRNVDWRSMSKCGSVRNSCSVATAAEKNRLLRRAVTINVSKVSSFHHIHYTLTEILTSCESIRSEELALLERVVAAEDVHQAAAAGFALWFNTLSDQMLTLIGTMGCWNEGSLQAMATSIKSAVRAAKLLQNNCELDLLPIFEAEVLLNRGIGSVDWRAERDNRVRPSTVKIADQAVYEKALNIMRQGKHDRGRYPTMSWEDYWKTRWQFTPTGSIKSQYQEDLADLPTDFRLKNKFVALNTTDKNAFDDWITKKPAIHAWSSVKYEWGKERAIYGCDVTNFVLTNFALFQCEDRLPPRFPVGSRAEPAYVSRAIDNILDGKEAYCFDFEDFNSQHSTGAMRAVLKAFKDTYYSEMSSEQKQAMAWVIKSVDEMVVHDNIGGTGTYHANGTLF